MAEHVVVLVTVEKQEDGERIAENLVAEKLAACVNIVPGLTSVYSWQGAVEKAKELLLVMKTRASLFGRLRARVVELHPYDVPEVLALQVEAGHAPYLAWIDESTAS